MTLDEAEQYLIALKYCEACEATDTNLCKTCPYWNGGSSSKCYEAIEIGVDAIRKYQKIQEIIADWKSDGGAFEMSEPYWLRLISEVIEDGNN